MKDRKKLGVKENSISKIEFAVQKSRETVFSNDPFNIPTSRVPIYCVADSDWFRNALDIGGLVKSVFFNFFCVFFFPSAQMGIEIRHRLFKSFKK